MRKAFKRKGAKMLTENNAKYIKYVTPYKKDSANQSCKNTFDKHIIA